MPSMPSAPADHMAFPFVVIPNTTHTIVPSVDAHESKAGTKATPLGVLHHNHAPLLLLPNDGEQEQAQRTFSDSDSDDASVESVRDERIYHCGFAGHPHAPLGDLRLPAHGNVARGQLGLLRVPDGPENTSTPPTSARPSAGVARRNRFFALGDNSIAGPRDDCDHASGDMLSRKAEKTLGVSQMELGVVGSASLREADPAVGRMLEVRAEGASAALKSKDIGTRCDGPSSKARDCITTY